MPISEKSRMTSTRPAPIPWPPSGPSVSKPKYATITTAMKAQRIPMNLNWVFR